MSGLVEFLCATERSVMSISCPSRRYQCCNFRPCQWDLLLVFSSSICGLSVSVFFKQSSFSLSLTLLSSSPITFWGPTYSLQYSCCRRWIYVCSFLLLFRSILRRPDDWLPWVLFSSITQIWIIRLKMIFVESWILKPQMVPKVFQPVSSGWSPKLRSGMEGLRGGVE